MLRLTYEVDVADAYDGEKDADKVMRRARDTVAQRLGRQAASVSAEGREVVVDLVALQSDELEIAKSVIVRPGRLQLEIVDDGGSGAVFGSLPEEALPPDSGIAIQQEVVPDGLDDGGKKKTVRAYYARVACRPAKYPTESLRACLERFEGWASSRNPPADHRIGFQAVTEPRSGGRLEQVGWRTLYLHARAELTEGAVADTSIGHDQGQNVGQTYVLLSFSPAGAARFEQVTGANVNRRMAIVLDDIVDSAPVIMTKIGGGKATITMGAGTPDKQEHDARQLELVLRSGALPAPLQLASEETLPKGTK